LSPPWPDRDANPANQTGLPKAAVNDVQSTAHSRNELPLAIRLWLEMPKPLQQRLASECGQRMPNALQFHELKYPPVTKSTQSAITQ
jgi:hypothetical protein